MSLLSERVIRIIIRRPGLNIYEGSANCIGHRKFLEYAAFDVLRSYVMPISTRITINVVEIP